MHYLQLRQIDQILQQYQALFQQHHLRSYRISNKQLQVFSKQRWVQCFQHDLQQLHGSIVHHNQQLHYLIFQRLLHLYLQPNYTAILRRQKDQYLYTTCNKPLQFQHTSLDTLYRRLLHLQQRIYELLSYTQNHYHQVYPKLLQQFQMYYAL